MAKRRQHEPRPEPRPTTGYSALDDAERVTPATAPDAFLITQVGGATGSHFTDRLTLDGLLEGYYHDDYRPGFVRRYQRDAGSETAYEVFEILESSEVRALPDRFDDGWTDDGFVLRLVIRLHGIERSFWMMNVEAPLLGQLVRRVWSLRPEPFLRELPPLPKWERA